VDELVGLSGMKGETPCATPLGPEAGSGAHCIIASQI
jgi:hypothetical protein